MVSATDMVKLQDMVNLIGSEAERVKQCVNALSSEALERTSPCELWTVGDVVGHLIWFAETYGGMMERGLRGDTSPTVGLPAPGTLSREDSEALYGQAAIDRRRDLGGNLLDAFGHRYDHLTDVLKTIGPEDWDKPCYHLIRIRPVHSFLPTIIQELAVHEWDIRSSLEASPSLSVDSIPTLIEEKIPTNRRPWALPFPTTPNSPGPLRYCFRLTGPAGGSQDIVVEGDKARLEASGEGSADLHLRGTSDTFALLMFGRLTLEQAIANGRFTAEGDLGLVADFDRWLAGH